MPAGREVEVNDAIERAQALVPVQYHQFDIKDEDAPAATARDQKHNGLVSVAVDAITVLTGIHTGDVDVTVTLHSTRPEPDSADWQEIVEISARSVSGELKVSGIMDDLDEELPILSFLGPGDYRLRIHARGRDSAVDLAPDEVSEWYLVQSWPEPPGKTTVLRQSDAYGASVRDR